MDWCICGQTRRALKTRSCSGLNSFSLKKKILLLLSALVEGFFVSRMRDFFLSPFCPLWYWCFYPHRKRNSVSPVCMIFCTFSREIQNIFVVSSSVFPSLLQECCKNEVVFLQHEQGKRRIGTLQCLHNFKSWNAETLTYCIKIPHTGDKASLDRCG